MFRRNQSNILVKPREDAGETFVVTALELVRDLVQADRPRLERHVLRPLLGIDRV